VLALAAGSGSAKTRIDTKSATTSRHAPARHHAPDPEGKDQSLAQWKGKILVVNFWATWCAPCREEMPMFMRLQDAQRAKGVQFVGIAVDNVDKVRQYASDLKLNYPTLIGGFGAMELSKTLGNSVMALPFTVIVDRSGKVAHTQLGPSRRSNCSRSSGNSPDTSVIFAQQRRSSGRSRDP
jgi:thiol-disulfide isomerase/thioredoxin